MPDWSSPIISAKLLDACEIIKWILVGILLLDHIEKIPFDWSIISGKRARRWPQIFYFCAKFFWYVFLCLHILLIKSETKINCQWVAYALESTMAVVNVCCSILLACRVTCIFPRGRSHSIISTVLGLASLALTGIWFAGSVDIVAGWTSRADGGGSVWTEGGCGPKVVTRAFSIKFVAIVVFDLFVLIATMFGILKLSLRGSTRLGSVLLSQGVFYFTITAVTNLTVCVLVLLQVSPLMSIAGAVPSCAISVFASTRLYVDLAQVAVPAHGTIELSQRSPKSGFREKFGAFLPSSSSKGFQTPSTPTSSKLQSNALSSHDGGASDMPYSNTVPLPSSTPARKTGLKSYPSEQDFESQVDSDQVDEREEPSISHPYAFSNNNAFKGSERQAQGNTVPILAPSGIPAYTSSSHSSSNHHLHQAQQRPGGTPHHQNQGLGVCIERTQEIRNEVIPSSFNFVVAPDEKRDGRYKHLSSGR